MKKVNSPCLTLNYQAHKESRKYNTQWGEKSSKRNKCKMAQMIKKKVLSKESYSKEKKVRQGVGGGDMEERQEELERERRGVERWQKQEDNREGDKQSEPSKWGGNEGRDAWLEDKADLGAGPGRDKAGHKTWWHREISSVLCDHLERWDRERGRETQEGGDVGIYVCI